VTIKNFRLLQRYKRKDPVDHASLEQAISTILDDGMELSNARSQKKLIGPCVICGAEGVEVKFRRFTEDAYHKATQHGTLASTWVLNVSQFCHSHYMIYIVHDTDKGSETSENAVSSKRRWIQGEAVTEQVDRDDSQQELIMETSEVSDDGRIKEIDLLNVLDRWRKSFIQEKRKKERYQYMIGSYFGRS